jgi:carbon-monoxide dehydrogenase large subunit
MVVAETAVQAKDAAELIEIDYESLPAVVDVRQAVSAGAPTVHDDAPGNVCYVWALGDKGAVDAAFSKAAHVTELEFVNNRLIRTPSSRVRAMRRIPPTTSRTCSTSPTRIRTSSGC